MPDGGNKDVRSSWRVVSDSLDDCRLLEDASPLLISL
jgi:hypothetical protein